MKISSQPRAHFKHKLCSRNHVKDFFKKSRKKCEKEDIIPFPAIRTKKYGSDLSFGTAKYSCFI